MENLLAMPITPFEIMLGKMLPYFLVGAVQVGADPARRASCSVCRLSAIWRCWLLLTRAVHRCQLSLGYTFSTLAQLQMQAVQCRFLFFLPSS